MIECGEHERVSGNNTEVLSTLHPLLASALRCACGNEDFKITFWSGDKFHHPIMEAECSCGRRKEVGILGRPDFSEPWVSPKSKKSDIFLPRDRFFKTGQLIHCLCRRKKFKAYCSEKEIVLQCSRSGHRYKRIFVGDRGINSEKPWVHYLKEPDQRGIHSKLFVAVYPYHRLGW